MHSHIRPKRHRRGKLRTKINCGLFAHPELLDLIERMIALDETCSLSDAECNRIAWDAASIENLCGVFWQEIRSIGGDLPDPGVRRLKASIWPYHDSKARDFSAALGFIWRVREWVGKVEAKHGTRCGVAG